MTEQQEPQEPQDDFEMFLEPLEPLEEPEGDEQEEDPQEEREPLDEDEAEDAEEDEEGEEDDGEEPPAPEPAEDEYEVKVNGEARKVSLQELKNGYSGQSHIREGMAQLSRERQALQAEREQFAAFAQQVQAQGVVPRPTPPNVAMMQHDPIGYMEAKAAYDAHLDAYNEQQYYMQQQTALHQQQQEALQQQFVQGQRKALAETVPEFFDADKGPALQKSTVGHALETYGLTQEELAGITDARHMRVLIDAARWRDLQGSKKEVTEKAAKARPALRPGQGKPSSARARKKQADIRNRARKGDDSAIARLFLE